MYHIPTYLTIGEDMFGCKIDPNRFVAGGCRASVSTNRDLLHEYVLATRFCAATADAGLDAIHEPDHEEPDSPTFLVLSLMKGVLSVILINL